MQKQAAIESLKEFGRVAVLAVIPVLIDSLSASSYSWRATLVAVILAVLRAIDKYVHEDKSLPGKGIVPF